MEPQVSGSSPRPGSEIVEKRSHQKRAVQRVRSRTVVQNEMKSVLGSMNTGGVRRTLNSVNSIEITV